MSRPKPGKTSVSNEQNQKNKINDEHKKEELDKYKKYYKNVLWIDDDCGDSEEENLRWLRYNDKKMLTNRDECYNIKTVKSFHDAADELNNRSYDLVIFDINLEKGINPSDNSVYIENIFKEHHINFKYAGFDENNNQKIAGEYLYLLLLAKGYPQSRMVIYSNNFDDFQKHSKLSKAQLFDFTKENELFISKNYSIDIDKYFKDNNSYYRVRRLVYQACNYWERKINAEDYDVPFNKLYGLDNEKQSFGDMLEQIKMMFSVIKPDKPEEVYYQVMHIVSMFHEEKADIGNIAKGVKPYHQMIRNFRNWSSHNKFKNHNLSADQFAFLFCVALRTYFDTQKHDDNKYHLNNELYYYEEVYFNNLKDVDWNEADKKINHIWEKALNKEVKFYGGRTNKKYLLKNIDLPTLLQRLGEQEFKMPFCYINTLMFKSPVKYDKDSAPIQIEVKNGNDEVTVTFNYKAKIVNVNESQFTEKNDVNKFFEKIAFSLMPSLEQNTYSEQSW